MATAPRRSAIAEASCVQQEAMGALKAWTVLCPIHVHASTRMHAHSHAPPKRAAALHHGRHTHSTAAVAEPQALAPA